MARPSIPTWFFALVVVRLGRRFLVVQERKKKLWYLPGGGVQPGETLVEAAKRECLEEAGIPVHIDGLVRLQHTVRDDGSARVRAVFTGVPADDTPPKAKPDEHTLRAAWVTLDELDRIPMRGREVRELFTYVANGGPTYPPDLLSPETAGFKR